MLIVEIDCLEGIRVRYSGLVAFVARALSLITGFAFTLIVTNRLSEQDFGIWQIIQNSYSYTLFISAIVSYWTIRSLARGEQAGKTSLIMALLLSVPASAIYLTVSLYFSTSLEINLFYFMIGWLQIPIMFAVLSTEAISGGVKPQVQSYAFIGAELVKITLAVPLLILANFGLEAVIAIIILTQVAQLGMLLYFNSGHLQTNFDKNLFRYWIKLSWLPMFSAIPGFIATFDVALVSSLVRSVEVIAFYKAAFLLATFVTYGQYIGVGLYPRLIRGGSSQDVQGVLQLMLLFVIPLAIGTFVMSQPLLHLLKSSYVDSYSALLILIPFSVAIVFYLFFDSIIAGTDDVEKDGMASTTRLLKSRLFLIPKIGLAYSGSYLALLLILLSFGDTTLPTGYGNTASLWSIAALVSVLPFTIYKGIIARSILHFSIPLRSAANYVVSSIVMALVLLVLNGLILTFDSPKYVYAFTLAGEITIGIAVYFAVLFILDPGFRTLSRQLIDNILKVEH